MKEKLDRLNDIKTENIIWVIYIFYNSFKFYC